MFEFHCHRQNFLKKPRFVHSSFFVFASASFIGVDFTTTQRSADEYGDVLIAVVTFLCH